MHELIYHNILVSAQCERQVSRKISLIILSNITYFVMHVWLNGYRCNIAVKA